MQLLLRPGSPVFQCFRRGLLTVAAGLALAGCGGGSSVDSGNPDGDCDPSAEYCGTVPISAAACTDTIYWPLSLRSATRPLIVHYSRLSDEAYQTWYMYGAAMFLHFLREQYFPQDSGFIARAWLAMRSEPPADRPDFIDALRSILLDERGVALDAAIVGFMQWRWFTGEFDDGNHFARGTEWPHPVAILQADAADASIVIDVRAMHYGAEFLRGTNDDSAERVFDVVLQNDDMAVSWRLTTVEGDDAASVLTVPAQSSRVLVAVALPSVPVSATTVSFDDHTARLTLTAR